MVQQMRVVLIFLALLAFGHSKEGSERKIKKIFDGMLEKEKLTLNAEAYKYRLAAFTLSYWSLSDDEKESIELMYDDEEVLKQNGAKMIEDLPVNEDLQKRSDEILEKRKSTTPQFFDGRYLKGVRGSPVIINPVIHQGRCGNCYLHVFVTALEQAYARATGKTISFSVQEITDCYDKGCDGGDYRMVSIFMSYMDKLSTRDVYGKYLDGQFTCRAGYAPDALTSIKVVDFVRVTPETVESAILQYGSVMACMAWSKKPEEACYMKTYKGGMYNGPEVKGGCDHAVLIVGYTPWYYIVRNSHGKTWGYSGYFIIKRGTNACGIEEKMAALVTETRKVDELKNKTKENGCPEERPNLCEDINICTKEDSCLDAISKRSAEMLMTEKRAAEMSRAQKVKRSEDDEVKIAKRCADKFSRCAAAAAAGKNVCVGTYLQFCQATCGHCSEIPVPVPVEETKETRGNCFKPTIEHGTVMNPNKLMRPGEQLAVRCEKGYVQTGYKAECLIQDIFTNEVQDARLMPECVKLGSNKLVGNGATYNGNKNTYRIGNHDLPCGVWNRDVLRGVLKNEKDALKLKIGNHNYCRNPGGIEPVPFCIGQVTGTGTIQYCFSHPGCDVCTGATDEFGDECSRWAAEGKCLYTDKTSALKVSYVQKNCRATCCKVAKC